MIPAETDTTPGCWVLGATGPTGRFLLDRMAAAGRSVIACSRRAQTDTRAAWRTLALEQDELPCPAETIVSLGPLDHLAGWLVRIETPRLRRVVALGSISVATKVHAAAPAERAMAARLAEAEESLSRLAAARGFDLTLRRAALIWDGCSDQSVAPLFGIARRWRVLPVPMTAGGWRNPVHADDLAALILADLQRPARPAGSVEILEAGGPERLRQRDILRRIAARAGAIPLPVPLGLMRFAARHLRPSLEGTLARWHQDQIAACPDPASMRGFLVAASPARGRD